MTPRDLVWFVGGAVGVLFVTAINLGVWFWLLRKKDGMIVTDRLHSLPDVDDANVARWSTATTDEK